MTEIVHLRAANGTPVCGATKHATTGLLTDVNCPACRQYVISIAVIWMLESDSKERANSGR